MLRHNNEAKNKRHCNLAALQRMEKSESQTITAARQKEACYNGRKEHPQESPEKLPEKPPEKMLVPTTSSQQGNATT